MYKSLGSMFHAGGERRLCPLVAGAGEVVRFASPSFAPFIAGCAYAKERPDQPAGAERVMADVLRPVGQGLMRRFRCPVRLQRRRPLPLERRLRW